LISHHNTWKQKCQEMEESAETPGTTTGSPNSSYTPVQRVLASLETTSASFLVLDSPILSTSMLLPIFTIIISLPKWQDAMILDVEPSSELEAKLQDTLHASNAIVEAHKMVIGGMQAQTILQSMYLDGVQGQLQAQEVKKSKKRKTGKINMDGHAKILTQDDIVEGVWEWQDEQDKAVEKAAGKKIGEGEVNYSHGHLESMGDGLKGMECCIEGRLGQGCEEVDC
jgi:hypothetical protein